MKKVTTQREFFQKLMQFRDKRRVSESEKKYAVFLLYSALNSGILRIDTAKKICCSTRYPVYRRSPNYAAVWQMEQDIKAGKTVYGIC